MGLREYVVRRIAQLVLTLWVFITILFFLFRMLPGDPTARLIPDGLSPAAQQQMMEHMGLTEPLHIQYITYLQNLLRGDFGMSYQYRQPVWGIISHAFWNTVFLMLIGLAFAYLIGITVGAIFAWKRGSKLEVTGVILALVSRSSPVFWTGILLIMIFSLHLEWFPAGRMHSVGETPTEFWARYFSKDFAYHMILPLATIVLYFTTMPLLLMRGNMIEVLNTDFIELKEAEGLSQLTILYKHAARNSLLPIITIMAIVSGRAVGGQILLEIVFNWPGMGSAMVTAINRNDYNVAMAAFFLMGLLVIVLNFLADLLYAVLDPRVQYD